MHVSVSSTNVDLTEALKVYIAKKLLPLEKYLVSFEKGSELHMKVEVARSTKHHKKGDVFYAELTLPLPGSVLRVEQHGEDIRVAIDEAKKRLKVEIDRFKQKGTEKDKKAIAQARKKAA
jgi:putative sigma-54 modulation protein